MACFRCNCQAYHGGVNTYRILTLCRCGHTVADHEQSDTPTNPEESAMEDGNFFSIQEIITFLEEQAQAAPFDSKLEQQSMNAAEFLREYVRHVRAAMNEMLAVVKLDDEQ